MASLDQALQAARSRGQRWITPQAVIVTGVIFIIVYLAVIPLAYLFWGTFWNGAGVTLDAFARAYSAYGMDKLIFNTLVFACGATALSVVIGTVLAYLVERTDVPFKTLIFIGAVVPLIVPGILYTISWTLLASPRSGLINRSLEPIFGTAEFLDVFSLPGMIFVAGLDGIPLVFLLMLAAFRSMDPSLEESASMSGARLTVVIRRVTIPLATPAILAATLLMLVRFVEAFETPAVLGISADVWVFTSRIYHVLRQYPVDFPVAGAYSITLLALSTVGVLLLTRATQQGAKFQTITGKAFRPRPFSLGPWRWVVSTALLLYFLVAIILPAVVLLHISTQPYSRPLTFEAFETFTLDNFTSILSAPTTLTAIRNSVLLGVLTATVVMFLAAVASWVVYRTRARGRWLVDTFASMPLVIPGIVLGVALLFMYLRSPIPIYATIWILLLAYTTRSLPYGMRYAATSAIQIGDELEESAKTSGATWWQSFRRILLPLLLPGLVTGWIYVFIVSARELSTSILLYSSGTEVLSVEIWQLWENGQASGLAALGVVMVGVLILIVGVARLVGARFGIR